MIGPQTRIGAQHKRIALANPGAAVPDGDGSYTQDYEPLTPPHLFASVKPAGASRAGGGGSAEAQAGGGTVLAIASHVVNCPFHSQVTTQTRITFEGRTLQVVGVDNVEERNAELELLCREIVP